MGVTGWLGEDDAEAAGPLPLANMLLAKREPQPGGVLEQALARSRATEAREAREQAASARDPDDFAASLIIRGYRPGQISQLSMKLGDTMAELADEEAKLEKAARRSERLHRDHVAGRITAMDLMRAMGDGDDGDEGRVRLLERRAESLRRQIGEAQEAVSQPPRHESDDGVEAATRRAHETFREVTRARWAEAQSGTARQPAPRPFVSRGAGQSTEHVPGGDCPVCAEGHRAEAAREEGMGVPFRSAVGAGEIIRAVDGGIVSIR